MRWRDYFTWAFQRSPEEIPVLTGVRGFAIFLLYLVHLYRSFQPQILDTNPIIHNLIENTSSCIDMFFVLSGFLIAGPLLKELRRSNTLDLKGFYIKRSLRIFPPYYIFLFFQFIVLLPYFARHGGALGQQVFQERWKIIYDLTYTSNYTPGTLFQGWSLSLEEQFYLFFPLFLLLLFRRIPERFQLGSLIALAAIPVLYRLYALFYMYPGMEAHYFYQKHLYFPFHGHIDSIVIGIIGAYIYNFRRHWVDYVYERPWLKKSILSVSLGSLVLFSIFYNEYEPLIPSMVLRFTLFSTVFAIVMILAIPEGGWINRFLSLSLFVPAARLSYVAYIVHMVTMMPVARKILGGGEVHYYQILLIFIPVGLVVFFWAYLLHLVAERPFMILKDRYTARRRAERASRAAQTA